MLLLLLLLHLVLLHVGLLLLFLNDLVHEDSFVNTAGSIQSWSPFTISLNLMLTAHRDRILVEIVVRTNLIGHSDCLHVVDLGTG